MKKTKLIFTIGILFLTNFITLSQTVTTTILTVNGSNSVNTINLGTTTNSTITLNALVTLPSAPSDSYPGTIKVLYQKNSLYPTITANGGDGGNLLFLGSTSSSRNFTITLDSSQFDQSGGYLYTEYTTFSGIKYKSSNIPISKSATPPLSGGGSNPSTQRITNIPYGGVPILPKFIPTSENSMWYIHNTETPLVTDRAGNRLYSDVVVSYRHELGFEGDGGCPITIRVERPFPNISQLHIVNDISGDQYVNIGQTAQTIIGNSAFISTTNPTTPLNNYQWQKRIETIVTPNNCDDYLGYLITNNWEDIPGATLKDYTPTSAILQPTQYRRLVIENPNAGINFRRTASSNQIDIYPINNSNISNTICCNQTVNLNTTINPIIGSTPTLPNRKYQWQEGYTNSDGSITWKNIRYTNTKDYTPIRPNLGRISSLTVKYRRMVINYDTSTYYPSNIITYTFTKLSNRFSFEKEEDKELLPSINIYPNPTSSILNIESSHNISTLDFKISDISGRIIYTRRRTNETSSLLSVDVSELPIGLYTLILEDDHNKIIKKFIKN